MSKYDTLLKKADFFEKVALYSDRKAFLQSLSHEEASTDSAANVDQTQTESKNR